MKLYAVAFLLLWSPSTASNYNPDTWLKDECEQGFQCIPLAADSFEDYLIEFQEFDQKNAYTNIYFLQSKKGNAGKNYTKGYRIKQEKGHRISRHWLYGRNADFTVFLTSERVGIVKSNHVSEGIVKTANGTSLWSIWSIFGQQPEKVEPQFNVEHSFVFSHFMVINKNTAIDVKKFIAFSDTGKLDEKGLIKSWNHGRIDLEHSKTPNDVVLYNYANQHCFKDDKSYCVADDSTGNISAWPAPVVHRVEGLVMLQKWVEVADYWVPIYRFYHHSLPNNTILYFPDIRSIYGNLTKNGKPTEEIKNIQIRGIMPQPKKTDKIFEFIKNINLTTAGNSTTPGPLPSTLTTTPASINGSEPTTGKDNVTITPTPKMNGTLLTTAPPNGSWPTTTPGNESDSTDPEDLLDEDGNVRIEKRSSNSGYLWGMMNMIVAIGICVVGSILS